MKTYCIVNKISGQDLGAFRAESADSAVEQMDREAGYASGEDAARALGTTVDEMRAELRVIEE